MNMHTPLYQNWNLSITLKESSVGLYSKLTVNLVEESSLLPSIILIEFTTDTKDYMHTHIFIKYMLSEMQN